MKQDTRADFSLWEIFIQHHYALLGLFYKDLIISSNSLLVQSNVPNDKNWEYLGYIDSFQYESSNEQRIYTNQAINSKNYELIYTDVWLANQLSSLHSKRNSAALEVMEVKEANDIEIFSDLFLEAYSLDTDPYGKLKPTYKSCIIKSFLSKQTEVKFYYVLYQGTPCATFALSFRADFCYSYCLGVIPKYRGLGISNFIHQYRNIVAAQNNCRLNILQTISTSHVETIAINNGFIPIGTFNLYERI